MLTRQRARRVLLIGGAGIGACAAALFFLSAGVSIEVRSETESCCISGGALVITDYDPLPMNSGLRYASTGLRISPGLQSSWYFLPHWHMDSGIEMVAIPLWIPLTVGLICGYCLLPESREKWQCPRCSCDLQGAPEVPVGSGRIRCPKCALLSEAHPSGRRMPVDFEAGTISGS